MFPELPMEPLTPEQWREFGRVRESHISLENSEPWDTRVKDHCHYTKKYRGTAHRKSNLCYTIPCYIPVIFHNQVVMMRICLSENWGRNSILDLSVSLLRIRRSISASTSMSLQTNMRPLWIRRNRLRDGCDLSTSLGSCQAAQTHSLGFGWGKWDGV